MRALDGTYWRVYWKPNPTECVRITAIVHHNFPDKGDAKDFMREIAHTSKAVLIVRIRPRMSIVKAVRLLTEARKQGVELWMQKTPPFCEPSWSKLSSTGIEMFACTYHHGEDWKDWSMSTGHILSKWIVATPEDARRIDRRGGK